MLTLVDRYERDCIRAKDARNRREEIDSVTTVTIPLSEAMKNNHDANMWRLYGGRLLDTCDLLEQNTPINLSQ